MDRKQREALVIALYEKDKTYREIAKELRMSPNTIKTILGRAGLDESTSLSSRAFELFFDGKNPLEVAIKLNLEADKAINLHKQYFMLLGVTEFTRVYLQVKENPWPFINLVKLVREAGISDVQVVKLLDIANNDLPMVKSKYENLKNEMDSLDCKKNNANKDYRIMCDEVYNLQKERDQIQSIIGQSRHEVAKLNQQKERMENFVNHFQNNNDTCVKIKEIVKQEIEHAISQPRRLIRIAIASIFESERKNPGKLRALYYNTSPTLSVEQLLSQSSINQNEEYPNQFGYNEDSLEKLLLDEAEPFYNRIVEAFAGKCINEITTDIKTSSQALHTPDTRWTVY
jgi:predicted transcriptional regulator